jgi:hypothetical protein
MGTANDRPLRAYLRAMASRSHGLFMLKRPRHMLAIAAIAVSITACVHLIGAWVDAEWSASGISFLLVGALLMAYNRAVVEFDHERSHQGRSLGGGATTKLRDLQVRFSTLAEELTREVVAFKVESWPPGMTSLLLEPTEPGAAPITAVVTDTEVMPNFGLGGHEEVRARRWRAHDGGLRRVDEVCRSVIDGRLEETVYLRGDRVLGSSATLTTPTGVLRSRTFWIRPRRTTLEVVRYAPYAD